MIKSKRCILVANLKKKVMTKLSTQRKRKLQSEKGKNQAKKFLLISIAVTAAVMVIFYFIFRNVF
jgi:hypothetical protein